MGFGFEAELRRAEATINRLIEVANEMGGGVYIGNKDKTGFSEKLTQPISISYWLPIYMNENQGD